MNDHESTTSVCTKWILLKAMSKNMILENDYIHAAWKRVNPIKMIVSENTLDRKKWVKTKNPAQNEEIPLLPQRKEYMV